jgi:pyruvate dehydrogenase E1 component beta subunit
LLVADTGHNAVGVSAEVIAGVVERAMTVLRQAPARIASPTLPCPTTSALADVYYPDARMIAEQVLAQCAITIDAAVEAVLASLQRKGPLDVPNPDYRGPF